MNLFIFYISTFYIIRFSGIARSQAHKRALGICARGESAAEAMRARPKKADLEKIRRDEALAKPVGEESKGFSLLSKMGYKPGMTLGKQKEGCKFYISIRTLIISIAFLFM